MTHYTPAGEIDFYRMWTDSQKRIAELEERIEVIKEEALRKLENNV